MKSRTSFTPSPQFATYYVPISVEPGRRKVSLLNELYLSQRDRDWWDDEMFLGLMRIRGMECRSRYAEAFQASKAVLSLGLSVNTVSQSDSARVRPT